MRLTGAHLRAIRDDFDRAIADFSRLVASDAEAWTRARPGHWRVGQHAAHIAVSLEHVAGSLEDAERRFVAGVLPRAPRRGLVQALFVRVAVADGHLPRGGRAPAHLEPGDAPERERVLARLAEAAMRHHALAERVPGEVADRIWIANPFRPAWHYRLPEALRMHAVHARHHGAQVAEILREVTRR